MLVLEACGMDELRLLLRARQDCPMHAAHASASECADGWRTQCARARHGVHVLLQLLLPPGAV